MSLNQALQWNGTAQALEATEDVTVQAAPAAGKRIYIQKGTLTVHLAATGGGGKVALEDGAGGARIVELDADAERELAIDFGTPGYPLTAATLLNITVDGAATNQASASVALTGIII